MAQIFQGFLNILKDIQLYVYIGVAIAVFTLGGMCLLGGEKGIEKAKSHAKGILVGCACCLGAVIIANYLTGKFNF